MPESEAVRRSAVGNGTVDAPARSRPTNVEGPRLTWRSAGSAGLTDDILDGTY